MNMDNTAWQQGLLIEGFNAVETATMHMCRVHSILRAFTATVPVKHTRTSAGVLPNRLSAATAAK
jgi:hypothetical protein